MSDRAKAGCLLNQMDGSKRFKTSIDDLEILAALLLCKEVHNSQKRVHLSQVQAVASRWTTMVEEEYRIMKKQNEKADILKAKKELLRMAENARQLKAELEEDERVNQAAQNFRYGAPTYENLGWMAGLEDPFVSVISSAKSSSASYISTNSIDVKRAQPTKSTDTLKKPHTLVRVKEVASFSSRSIPQLKESIGLITPKSTPEDLKDHKKQDRSKHKTPSKPQRQSSNNKPVQPFTPPSSIKVPRQPTEFNFEYGPGFRIDDSSKNQLGRLNAVTEQTWPFHVFDDTNEEDKTPISKFSPHKQLALNAQMAPIPRVPLGAKNASSHNNMKKKRAIQAEYEFGNQKNMPLKSFNFETNAPGSMLANLAPSPPPVLNTYFVFDQSSEGNLSAMSSKDPQPLTECRLPAALHTKSDIQPKSKSQSILKTELGSMSQPDFHIKTPPMSKFYQKIDTDAIIDTKNTTPPTKIFPSPTPDPLTPPSNPKYTSKPSPSPEPKTRPTYGTALINPSSTAFKTHLPSRRSRTSLYTPFPSISNPHPSPTTQTKTRTPTSPGSYKADLQIWERIIATEKPLPSLPWEPVKLKEKMVEGKSEMDDDDDEEEDEKEEIRCLGSRRAGRVWRRVLGVWGRS